MIPCTDPDSTYVSDISCWWDTPLFYLFADDTNKIILYADKSLNMLEKIINKELVNVRDWVTSNKLTLNIKNQITYYSISTISKQVKFWTKNNPIWQLWEYVYKYVDLENKKIIKHLGIFIEKIWSGISIQIIFW